MDHASSPSWLPWSRGHRRWGLQREAAPGLQYASSGRSAQLHGRAVGRRALNLQALPPPFHKRRRAGGSQLGNLFVAALSEITRLAPIKLSSQVLATRGHIYPVTTAISLSRRAWTMARSWKGDADHRQPQACRRAHAEPRDGRSAARNTQSDRSGGCHHRRAGLALHQPDHQSAGTRNSEALAATKAVAALLSAT